MTFAASLSGDAQRDFYRAQAHYDAEAPEQTDRFVDEFFAASRRLQDFPYSAPVIRGTVRRVSLRVFPYQVWYRVQDEAKAIEIIAVLHYRQDPTRLDKRVQGGD